MLRDNIIPNMPGKNIFTPKDQRIHVNMNSIYKGHHKITYKGVKIIKCPMDYVIYQMIISELQPDLVIEIGTNAGGAAIYMADLMNMIGNGIVHSIDIEAKSSEEAKKHPRVKLFTNGWENYDLREVQPFKKVMVIEDSSHTYENTIKVMNKFADCVTVGSYLIVEDGIVNNLGIQREYGGGPIRAINEFLKSRNDYIVDREWTDFFGRNATFNVKGYLKKIK